VLSENGHVFVETGSDGAGFNDQDYQQAGAQIVPTPGDAWNREVVVKVKEPLLQGIDFFRKGCCLPTFGIVAFDRAFN